MTLESTPEQTEVKPETKTQAPEAKSKEPVTIPKTRFDQVNNKYKDTQRQLAELQAKMAEMTGSAPEAKMPEIDTDFVAEQAAQVANQIVEQRTAELRAELEFKARALDLGLTSQQAKLIQDNQSKYGMDFDTAERFARSENPKVFTQLVRSGPFGGQGRGSGMSPLRDSEPKRDYVAEATKAREAGRVAEGLEGSSFEISAEAFRQRIARHVLKQR
jgi:hypothetical protein